MEISSAAYQIKKIDSLDVSINLNKLMEISSAASLKYSYYSRPVNIMQNAHFCLVLFSLSTPLALVFFS
jgi:hypothetical protein